MHKKNKEGQRFIDKPINNLPFELHAPGYQYCGPGTELKKRLARGDRGINKLDSACEDHGIAYRSNQIGVRKAADQVLIERASQIVRDKDASLGEKASAYLVTNLMKLKSKLGMGLQSGKWKSKKERKINLKNIINLTKKRLSVSAAAVQERVPNT